LIGCLKELCNAKEECLSFIFIELLPLVNEVDQLGEDLSAFAVANLLVIKTAGFL
jgi:hypothetical protein